MRSKTSRKQRRRAVRRMGEREITRRSEVLARRVLELAEAGHRPETIASSTGLPPWTVRRVLELKEEAP